MVANDLARELTEACPFANNVDLHQKPEQLLPYRRVRLKRDTPKPQRKPLFITNDGMAQKVPPKPGERRPRDLHPHPVLVISLGWTVRILLVTIEHVVAPHRVDAIAERMNRLSAPAVANVACLTHAPIEPAFLGVFVSTWCGEHDPMPLVAEISDVDDASYFSRMPAARLHPNRILVEELGIKHARVFAFGNLALHIEVVPVTNPTTGDLLHKARGAGGKIVEMFDWLLRKMKGRLISGSISQKPFQDSFASRTFECASRTSKKPPWTRAPFFRRVCSLMNFTEFHSVSLVVFCFATTSRKATPIKWSS